jgi:hypothetical protein
VSWAKTRLFIGVADQMCIFVGADHLSGSYCYIYIQYCTWIALLLSYYTIGQDCQLGTLISTGEIFKWCYCYQMIMIHVLLQLSPPPRRLIQVQDPGPSHCLTLLSADWPVASHSPLSHRVMSRSPTPRRINNGSRSGAEDHEFAISICICAARTSVTDPFPSPPPRPTDVHGAPYRSR